MMSSPSDFTHRVYGVSFSVLNLLASSSETSAFFLAISAIEFPYACGRHCILMKNASQRVKNKDLSYACGCGHACESAHVHVHAHGNAHLSAHDRARGGAGAAAAVDPAGLR